MDKISQFKERPKIARFRIKPVITIEDPKIRPGGTWIHNDCTKFTFRTLYDEYDITLNIGSPDDLSKWNDFDYILVLDEAFGQPYTPFYAYLGGTSALGGFAVLNKIIESYNMEMRSLPFLEEIEDD